MFHPSTTTSSSINVRNKVEKWQLSSDSTVKYTFNVGLSGAAAVSLSDEDYARLAKDSDIAVLEPDHEIHALSFGDWDLDSVGSLVNIDERQQQLQQLLEEQEQKRQSLLDRIFSHFWEQDNPLNWGLDRIDNEIGEDGSYRYSWTGEGVNMYIVDSGVNRNHVDVRGRAHDCFTVIDYEECTDTYGHGTHIAGIAAGLYSGVAKGANIIDVKVVDSNNSGRYSRVIEAIGWIVAQQATDSRPGVINMSVGGPVSAALNLAVTTAVEAGIVVVAAAGNTNTDSCSLSPASANGVITVAASDRNDVRAGFSNYGDCVDLFAPGTDIHSSYWLDATKVVTKSGTSMAAPFVAGVAALYLERDPTLTPAEVLESILVAARYDLIEDARSDNILLNTQDLLEEELGDPVLSSSAPTGTPTATPTFAPTSVPSLAPTNSPTARTSSTPPPSLRPTRQDAYLISPPLVPSLTPSMEQPAASLSPTEENDTEAGFCAFAIIGRCTEDDDCCSRNCLSLLQRCFFSFGTTTPPSTKPP